MKRYMVILMTLATLPAFGQDLYAVQETNFYFVGPLTHEGKVVGLGNGRRRVFDSVSGETVDLVPYGVDYVHDMYGDTLLVTRNDVAGKYLFDLQTKQYSQPYAEHQDFNPIKIGAQNIVGGSLPNDEYAVWDGGTLTVGSIKDVVSVGFGSYTWDMSDNGYLAIQERDTSGSSMAVQFKDGVSTIIDHLPGDRERPRAINTDGAMVIEYKYRDPDGTFNARAYVHDPGGDSHTIPFASQGGRFMAPWGMNNHGDVVGSVDGSGPNGRYPFLYKDGTTYDLDALVASPEYELKGNAELINDAGQIIVRAEDRQTGESRGRVLVTPLPNSPAEYEAPDMSPDPLDRLGLWNGEMFVPVTANSIPEGADVRIMTHGWKPGYEQAVLENPGLKVWDDEARNADGARADDWLEPMAQMMQSKDPDSVVLAFSWIDMSATEEVKFADPGTYSVARQSQSHTQEAGTLLKSALLQAFSYEEGSIVPAVGNVHLLGHSHGSKVATVSAVDLDLLTQVDQLTLWDSPEIAVTEGGLLVAVSAGNNDLKVLLEKLQDPENIGEQTFVDNYTSLFGEGYDVDEVHNALLYPTHLEGISPKHRYAVDWYLEASEHGLGFEWALNQPTDDETLVQDWLNPDGTYDSSREFVLVTQDEQQDRQDELLSRDPTLNELYTNGGVSTPAVGFSQIDLIEESPAFWYGSLLTEEDDELFELTYEFIDAGDGDQLGVWIDGDPYLILTGVYADEGEQSVQFSIEDLDPGMHVVTFALHSTGEANAEIMVKDFQLVSVVPEPSSLALLVLSIGGILSRRMRSA